MYRGSVEQTASRVTKLSCRSCFITTASARNLCGSMVPSLSFLIATFILPFHFPVVKQNNFYRLAVKTGSIALQIFFFFFLVCGKKLVFWGRNNFFQIRCKKQMGHPSLLFLIFLQVLQ